MKSCPKCNRTFPDEGQKFCTFDGGLLIAPQTFDPNATIRATSIDLNAPSERPTSPDLPDPNATIIENYPATVALPRNTGPTTGPTSSNTSDIARPPAAPPPAPPPPPPPPVAAAPPPPPPPPPVAQQHVTAEVPVVQPAAAVPTPAPSTPLPPPPAAAKKSKLPLIIGLVLVLLLLGGGALVGVFFFVVKPRLDQMAGEHNPQPTPSVVVNNSTPTPAPSVEAPSPTPEDAFVPPPGTVQFVNSSDKLDGKLAEHYLDFSFYYPEKWTLDSKACVAGASNFVKVDRVLPPNFTQENFVVGWYTSSGTFVGDLSSFPARVEDLSKALAKSINGYKKVSEGPTKVNSMDAYEFRWEGLSPGTERGDINLWGRVIFLPTGKEGDTTGATLSMLGTNLAGELSSVEDIGTKGETPVILDSFRFGKKK